MKKMMLLTVTLLTVYVVSAQAQWNDFVYGFKGGWNVSNLSNANGKNKLSVHWGAFAEWRLNDYVGISPEILYSRQGFRDKFHLQSVGKVKQRVQVNYLNIPVLAKLYVFDVLSVDLGPQFGFILNSKDRQKSDHSTTKTDIKDFNTLDVSFALGASYRWNEFIFSARYNLGLTNVFDHWSENNKNRVFQLSVGYCLNNLF